ncbi:hypothetical protein BJ878DRAFT_26408 [Calycina marina]|uniref:Myb-like domain-containing protein n=1 Tax=Calycina marina TaxID=1763456 RepID=A0A9P7ZAG7_9HELO|nr:hypothetical protein BJ878DRAFT_26408 [Calycina marina]
MAPKSVHEMPCNNENGPAGVSDQSFTEHDSNTPRERADEHRWTSEEDEKLKSLCIEYFSMLKAGTVKHDLQKHWELLSPQIGDKIPSTIKRRWVTLIDGAPKNPSTHIIPHDKKSPVDLGTSRQSSMRVDSREVKRSAQIHVRTEKIPSRLRKSAIDDPSLSSGQRWSKADSELFLSATREELAAHPNANAAHAEFWTTMQSKLRKAGIKSERSVASLRSRWWTIQNRSTEGKAENNEHSTADLSYIGRDANKSSAHRPANIEVLGASGGDNSGNDNLEERAAGTTSLHKRPRKSGLPPGYFDLTDYDTPRPVKKARRHDPNSSFEMSPTIKSVSELGSLTPQTPSNSDDHAFAQKKVAAFNNDIEVLGAQKNGHLLVLDGVSSELARVLERKARLDKQLKKLADEQRCLTQERDLIHREIDDVDEKIDVKRERRDAWTATLAFC